MFVVGSGLFVLRIGRCLVRWLIVFCIVVVVRLDV